MACRSGVHGNTLGRYINTVLIQSATQLGGSVGNHAGGWGAARVLATVVPVWDELWAALDAEGESSVPMASCAAYALASDYAGEDVHCSTQADGKMRFVMYNHAAMTPVVLYDVTIRLEYFREGGQPQWSKNLIDMWRYLIMRHWEVDMDMCFDRYVRVYLRKRGNSINKSTCNSANISWDDVRNNKNTWRKAGNGAKRVM
ncbi:hypothetical protein BGZ70_010194 [Mortierella alpina]|uniref:Uncharacterized protein n=1 Tax=Mortierella alpina TaxID=64518 RepID=A0A9P6LZI5_MORAP|nr:hypothetical protein BGZ70_010194 [Mortierella alpina]